MRFIFFFIFFINLNIFSVFGQEFSWAKRCTGVDGEQLFSICPSNDGNLIVAGRFNSLSAIFNSFYLNKFTSNSNYDAFVSKITKDGVILWLKQLRGYGAKNIFKVRCDNHGKIYILSNLSDIVYLDTATLNANFPFLNRVALLKLNENGNLIGNQRFTGISSLQANHLEIDNNSNPIVVLGNTHNDTIYYNGGYFLPQGNVGRVLKLDTNLNVSWSSPISSFNISDMDIDTFNNIILSGLFGNSITIGNKTEPNWNGSQNNAFLSSISPLGFTNWIKPIFLQSFVGGNPTTKIQTNKDNSITLVGVFGSTAKFDTSFQIIGFINFSNLFVSNYSENGKLNWVKFGKSGYNTSLNLADIESNSRGDIYIFCQPANGYFKFQNTQIKTLSNLLSYLLLIKLDKEGNELYSFGTGGAGDSPREIAIDEYSDVYLSGIYFSHVNFGNLTLLNGGGSDGFLVKLPDISITQIHSTKRNYCSGDSLYLSYSTAGKFKLGNKFKVQLSDSAGFFDSLSTVIGIRQDTCSNTIACKLPNSIIGSKGYRLRIISDSPMVASFYDTVVYHIEPTPIANAGSDTFACFGRSVQLGSIQSHASKYYWEPGIFIMDSLVKIAQTKIGLNAGIYSIRLNASNQHCKNVDTVYVSFLSPLKITLPQDTIFCHQSIATLNPKLIGGLDSINYSINWYLNGFSNTLGTGKSVSVPTDSTSIVYALLNDGCSLADTSATAIQIARYRKLQITSDTFMCIGKSLIISPKNYRPDTIGYKLNWLDENWNLKISGDSLKEAYLKTTNRYLISEHLCKTSPDTAVIQILVAPALNFSLMQDTTLCNGKGFYLRGFAEGGDSTHYQIRWNQSLPDSLNFWSYNSIKKESEFYRYFQFSTDTLLQAALSDDCSINNANDSVWVMVLPKLSAQSYTIPKVCEGNPIWLLGFGSSGKSPFQYSWIDSLTLSVLANKDSLFLPLAQEGSYWFSISDQCNDKDSVWVKLKPEIKPKAGFHILDSLICAEDIGRIDNTSSNSQMLPMNYYWLWQNGNSTAHTPLPQFNKSGVFDLELIVTMANTCSDTFFKAKAFTVNPKPKVNFSSNKTTVSKNDALVLFINLSSTQGQSSYLWDFGDGNSSFETDPQNMFVKSGWYTVSLRVTNEFGCSDSLSKYHMIWVQGGKSIYIPNAITLNNDGLNEDFKPYGTDVKSWQIQVFDRTGNKVFLGNEATGGFKGIDSNRLPLPAGVFVYNIMVTTQDDEILYFNGTITVLR